jgi:hypothetical protein
MISSGKSLKGTGRAIALYLMGYNDSPLIIGGAKRC